MGVTHVTGVPDSTTGPWFDALRDSGTIRLVPVCREGEAWGVAAGLVLGGAQPLVMMQCTGLFESGDALRNAIHDFGLPIYAVIGYRNYLNQAAAAHDTSLAHTEPILRAWGLDYVLIDSAQQKTMIRDHFERCRQASNAGVALLAEGKG
jgi:sulfopyruvate decarboxylase TPP-binding subunit